MRGVDATGRIIAVSTVSDTIFLYYWLFAAPLFSALDAEPDLFLFGVAIMAAYAITIYIVSVAIQSYAKKRLRGIVLKTSESPLLHGYVVELTAAMDLRHSPMLLWRPTDFTITARVFGGRRPILFVSGGFVVYASRNPELARRLLSHELAHLKHGDQRLYLYSAYLLVLAACAVMSALLLSALSITVGSGVIVGGAVIFAVEYALFLFVARRREYFADVEAMNSCESVEDYLTLLNPRMVVHESRFHPRLDARRRAIISDSPVLRVSYVIVLLCAGPLLGIAYEILMRASQLSVGGLFSNVLAVVTLTPVLRAELAKGTRRKRPATVSDLRSVTAIDGHM